MSELKGWELDKAVAEIMGWKEVVWSDFFGLGGKPPDDRLTGAYGMATVPSYSTDIAAAWTVHQKACEWLFSKRQRYMRNLQYIASDDLSETELAAGRLVAWEGVLVALRNRMPEAICRAALAAAGGTGG